MKRLAGGFISLVFLAAASSLSAAFCPQVPPVPEPLWVDLVSNTFNNVGLPATSLLFTDLNPAPRTAGQRLPYTVEVPPSAIGAWDTDTFPAGPVFYSNSSGASVNCLPGIDPTQPNGCPYGQVGTGCATNGDCTGKPIQRTPATGILSAFSTHVAGIHYLGTFDGTANVPPGAVLQIVFFHQSRDYLAGAEYGFYRDPTVPNLLVVYWQTNANCTLRPANGVDDSMCTTKQADREPSTYLYTDSLIPGGAPAAISTTCNIDLSAAGGLGRYYYSMWVFSDHGMPKFAVSVRDPDTLQPVVADVAIDPNAGVSSAWFPIGPLNGAGGYVTAGITRYDPLGDQKFPSPAPSMSVERLAVGKVALSDRRH